MKLTFQLTSLAIAMLLSGWGPAFALVPPQEPSDDFLVNEDMNIVTGLYTREYSLRHDGVVDYRTARQILRTEYSSYGDESVLTKAFPLFYWYDAQRTGTFSMWLDREGNGREDDIMPYVPLAGDDHNVSYPDLPNLPVHPSQANDYSGNDQDRERH